MNNNQGPRQPQQQFSDDEFVLVAAVFTNGAGTAFTMQSGPLAGVKFHIYPSKKYDENNERSPIAFVKIRRSKTDAALVDQLEVKTKPQQPQQQQAPRPQGGYQKQAGSGFRQTGQGQQQRKYNRQPPAETGGDDFPS